MDKHNTDKTLRKLYAILQIIVTFSKKVIESLKKPKAKIRKAAKWVTADKKRLIATIALIIVLLGGSAAELIKLYSNSPPLKNDTSGSGNGQGISDDNSSDDPINAGGSNAPGSPYVDLHVEGVHNTGGEGYPTQNGAKNRPMLVELIPRNTDLSSCQLNDVIVLDDQNLTTKKASYPAVAKQTVVMEDGLHTLTVDCPVGGGISDTVRVRVMDRQPKLCKDFVFSESAITASSLADVQNGMLGIWEGCVTTPWVIKYYVTITFKNDGTYSAVSDEVIDGQEMNAMYYGTEEDSPKKKYYINDFLANQNGWGEIDIFFGVSSVSRGDLKYIKLMGNKLSFEFFHGGGYGPVKFELYKQ